jgi:predicted nucleic-acid-binding Zn-ribbon protein
MTVARKCENCGNVDTRVTWKSNDDASKDPVFEHFTCPKCAWTEFDLVEAEARAEPAGAST